MNTNSEIAKTGETVESAGTGESAESTVSQRNWQDLLLEWWPVLLGLVVLYYPTFRDLSNGVWQTDDQAHGPIILLVIGYLFYDNHKVLYVEVGQRSPVLGGLAFVFGLLLFALGRSQEILVFELGALVWILGGVLLVSRGWQGIKAFWFPVMFCIFLIPLPGILVDALTGPLKGHISVLAENILYEVGYPISRDGVTIIIGQYQLLVADACSGLHSMFSLSALGLLYLYLMRYTNLARNGLMIVSILPISFAANVVRVIILILVTYHFGDEAGQGIIHGMAGMLLFVISLIFLFVFDSLLGRFPWFRDAAKVEVK